MGDSPISSSFRRRLVACTLVSCVVGALLALSPSVAGADDLATADAEGAQELASKYAPVFMLKEQEEPCDRTGEPWAPTSVDILLGNPQITLRQVTPGDPVVMTGPEASDLFGLGAGFYLDFPGLALEPGCVFEQDFERFSTDQPPVVYAHIVKQDGHDDQLALQYWSYWYYNDWNNKHESDWEGIQLLFEASTIEEALASEPISVGYAQHEGGEKADWDDSKLEREGSRPVVYSSAGSHASYYGSAFYLGRSGSEGFGCDNTDGPSFRVDPEAVVLPDSVDDPNSELAWLAFEGRWGERQSGPFNGPTGPAAKSRWLEPIDWHEELRSSSVLVPGGAGAGTTVINAFCGIVEWGSGTLILFTTSPLRVVLAGAAAALALSWAAGRTVWNLVSPSPLRRRRRAGQIIRLAAHLYRHPKAFLALGLVYLPTSAVVGLLGVLVAILPLLGDLLDVGGGGTNFFMALLAGGIPNAVAVAIVNAMTATRLEEHPDGAGSSTEALAMAWSRMGDLMVGLAKAIAIVLGLLITVVGIPWAIRQVVRYQFLPHVVMLEGVSGSDSLHRSSELVQGRWWHTALMVGLSNALVLTTGLVVGLLLLVLFAAVPIWLFSVLVTAMYGLVVPATALVVTYLYGDAVAEEREAGEQDAGAEPALSRD